MQPLIVTAAVIRSDRQILIARRPEGKPHAGLWEFPGGKLDQFESPRDCLRREIREELGVEIMVGKIIEAAYHRYEGGPVLILAYDCRILSGEIRNLQVSEHRWVSAGDLTSFALLPADIPIAEALLRCG